jgi:hypothetical protein
LKIFPRRSPFWALSALLLTFAPVATVGCGAGSTSSGTSEPTATPVYSPGSGTYTTAQSVSITDATAGASIFYTTDGSAPTSSSTPYTAPIAISTTTTLQALATAPGSTTSSIASAAYTITLPAATPTFSPAAGTYTSPQSVAISDATPASTIYFTTDGSTPSPSSTVYAGPIAVAVTATVRAVATAPGASSSAVAAATYTITPPAAAPAFSPAGGTYNSAQTVTISDATAGAMIFYTTDGSVPTTSSTTYSGPISIGTTTTLKAIATAPGSSTSAVASETLTIDAATPSASPVAGSYTSVQNVTLSTLTTGAKIYYTTDGSTPTAASTLYTGPIAVASTLTINAVASLNGQLSSVLSASYVINLPAASVNAYAGSGQSVEVGNGFATPLTVQVLTATNTTLAGVAVSFSTPAAGPSVTFSSPSCTTDSNGLCSVSARANTAVGTYTVTAAAASLNAAFTLTNTGLHSYVVTVSTDTTTGVASNCVDQPVSSGSANLNCSLRDALRAAAASATSSEIATITFAQTSPTTITLSYGSLQLSSYTTLQGATSGSGTRLANLITVDGNNSVTVFTAPATVTQTAINNLTIAHGYASQVGGGLYSLGSLNVNNSTFLGNQSAVSGGAVGNNGGTLNIFGSTFSGNVAQAGVNVYGIGGAGGGVDNYGNGVVNVSNSTFTGNSAYDGGGLYNSGKAAIVDSTIAGNTGSFGAGLYNEGTTFTVSNSIVNGNSNEDCGGVFCDPLWTYVLFAPATTMPVDSSSITIAFTDSFGNSFSQTATYGPFSTGASIASTFGPYFYENRSGLDTVSITGESFGNLFVLDPLNGATLSALTITNPGKSFIATQETYPNPLSINNNVHDLSSSQINLAPLQNNGGPTETMMPLTGSAALCVVSPSTAAGTDQRGQPRVSTVGAITCQDAGAVQTND